MTTKCPTNLVKNTLMRLFIAASLSNAQFFIYCGNTATRLSLLAKRLTRQINKNHCKTLALSLLLNNCAMYRWLSWLARLAGFLVIFGRIGSQLSCLYVLNQNVNFITTLIDYPPKVMQNTVDLSKYLIKIPGIN